MSLGVGVSLDLLARSLTNFRRLTRNLSGRDDAAHAISNGRKAAAKGDWKDDVSDARAKAAGVKRQECKPPRRCSL